MEELINILNIGKHYPRDLDQYYINLGDLTPKQLLSLFGGKISYISTLPEDIKTISEERIIKPILDINLIKKYNKGDKK